MFGIGVSELLVIFLVALLVLGPERLPQAARTLAKLFGEFRKATDDLRSSLVGVSDVEEDWRRGHNNPRILNALDTEKEGDSIARNALNTEGKASPDQVEKTNG